MKAPRKLIRWQRIAKMRDNGKSWAQIAEKLGVSESTVIRVYESEEDREVIIRAKRKPSIRTANKALEAATVQQDSLAAELTAFVNLLRQRYPNVEHVTIDTSSGVAQVHSIDQLSVGGTDAEG